MNVLFVCGGNVARSQYAAAFFNALSQKRRAASAGTHVVDDGGEGMSLERYTAAVLAAKDAGLDLSRARRTQVTAAMVEQADKVVVITAPSGCPDFIRRSPKTVFWDIADPKGLGYKAHCATCNQIETKVRELVKQVG